MNANPVVGIGECHLPHFVMVSSRCFNCLVMRWNLGIFRLDRRFGIELGLFGADARVVVIDMKIASSLSDVTL